jgi:predicted permease
MLMLAASRAREFATRVALGGGRLRLLRQSVVEGLVLGTLAAMSSLAIASFLLRAFPVLVVDREIVLDARVLVAGVSAALVAGIASTVIPSLLFTRQNLTAALRSSHQIASAGGRLRNSLVMTQVALASALLISAGVLAKSFVQLMSVDPGFERRSVLTARLWLPNSYATSADQQRFFDAVLEQARTLPGVCSAATIQDLPLRGNAMTFDLALDTQVDASAAYRVVSDGYFDAMRIPILRGRAFTNTDRATAPAVFVINRALANRSFAGMDPIGHRVRIGDDSAWGTIVGIAGDVKHMGLAEEEVPAIYQPASQKTFDWLRWTTLVLRTDTSASALTTPLRRAVMSVDPNQPVFEIVTLEDVLGDTVAKPRLSAWIVGAFGAIAFVIGLIGVGGVLSYAVALRTRELGVRLALGARPAEMIRLVLFDGGRLVIPGVLLGLALAVSLSPLLERLLFRIAALDASVYALVAMAVLTASALAAVVPARRAAGVDPAQALSAE